MDLQKAKKKVLFVGLNKTGTKSLHAAMVSLGYRSCHIAPYQFHDAMIAAMKQKYPLLHYLEEWDTLQDIWLHSGIEAKYYENSYFWSFSFKKTVLKKLICDYPDMLFVNNVRPLDPWLSSRKRHIAHNQRRQTRVGAIVDPWLHFDDDACRREYREHQGAVAEAFLNHRYRLLTLDATQKGAFNRLRHFLDGEATFIPDFELPHIACPYHPKAEWRAFDKRRPLSISAHIDR